MSDEHIHYSQLRPFKPVSQGLGELHEDCSVWRIQQDLAFAYDTQIECEVWFGLESVLWTHEQRCEALAKQYDDIWQNLGGKGGHPYADKFRKEASQC